MYHSTLGLRVMKKKKDRVSGIVSQVPVFRSLVPGFGFHVPGFGVSTSLEGGRASNRVLSVSFRVPGFGFRISKSRLSGSGIRGQHLVGGG